MSLDQVQSRSFDSRWNNLPAALDHYNEFDHRLEVTCQARMIQAANYIRDIGIDVFIEGIQSACKSNENMRRFCHTMKKNALAFMDRIPQEVKNHVHSILQKHHGNIERLAIENQKNGFSPAETRRFYSDLEKVVLGSVLLGGRIKSVGKMVLVKGKAIPEHLGLSPTPFISTKYGTKAREHRLKGSYHVKGETLTYKIKELQVPEGTFNSHSTLNHLNYFAQTLDAKWIKLAVPIHEKTERVLTKKLGPPRHVWNLSVFKFPVSTNPMSASNLTLKELPLPSFFFNPKKDLLSLHIPKTIHPEDMQIPLRGVKIAANIRKLKKNNLFVVEVLNLEANQKGILNFFSLKREFEEIARLNGASTMRVQLWKKDVTDRIQQLFLKRGAQEFKNSIWNVHSKFDFRIEPKNITFSKELVNYLKEDSSPVLENITFSKKIVKSLKEDPGLVHVMREKKPSGRLPSISAKMMIKKFEKQGWKVARTKGNLRILKKSGAETVPIPYRAELSKNLVSIYRKILKKDALIKKAVIAAPLAGITFNQWASSAPVRSCGQDRPDGPQLRNRAIIGSNPSVPIPSERILPRDLVAAQSPIDSMQRINTSQTASYQPTAKDHQPFAVSMITPSLTLAVFYFLSDPKGFIKGVAKLPETIVSELGNLFGIKKKKKSEDNRIRPSEEQLEIVGEKISRTILACYTIAQKQWMVHPDMSREDYTNILFADWKVAVLEKGHQIYFPEFVSSIQTKLEKGLFSEVHEMSASAHLKTQAPPPKVVAAFVNLENTSIQLAASVEALGEEAKMEGVESEKLHEKFAILDQRTDELSQLVTAVAASPDKLAALRARIRTKQQAQL